MSDDYKRISYPTEYYNPKTMQDDQVWEGTFIETLSELKDSPNGGKFTAYKHRLRLPNLSFVVLSGGRNLDDAMAGLPPYTPVRVCYRGLQPNSKGKPVPQFDVGAKGLPQNYVPSTLPRDPAPKQDSNSHSSTDDMEVPF